MDRTPFLSRWCRRDDPPQRRRDLRAGARLDLGPKKDDYERAGVGEYVILTLEPDEVFWFVLREGRFERVASDADGHYRSEAFPGLWLDPVAFFAEDLPRLFASLDLGLATPEHAAFVDRLARAGRTP